MKKKFSFIGMALIAFATVAGFSACSNDDDDNPGGSTQELATPAYEADAALFDITSSNSDFSSIELTAAGNYMVVLDQTDYWGAPKKMKKTSAFRKSMVLSRGYSNGIIEGKFTKTGPNTYKLAGFGTITVTSNGSTAVDLDITLEDGTDVNVTAARKNQKPSSLMTNNLCRTWSLERFRYTIKINGRVRFDKEVSVNNLRELFEAMNGFDEDEDMDWDDIDAELEEFPKQVIFTKAGTYLVEYRNSSLAISTWSWVDENAGILRYSWDYDDMENDDDAGDVLIAFPGNNRMIITESYVEFDEEDGERYEEITTCTLNQL